MSHQIDSMSSYSQIDQSRYNAVLSKGLKSSSPPAVVIVDTQQQLSRQLEQSFLQKTHGWPVLILIRTTRIVLIAFVYPPYFFLYMAPQWLYEKISPLLVDLLEKGSERMSRVFLRISAWSADVFGIVANRAKALLLKAKNTKKKQSRKGDNLFQALAKDLRTRFDQVKQVLKEWRHALIKKSRSFYPRIQNRMKPLQLAYHHLLKRLAEPFVSFSKWGSIVKEQGAKLIKAASAKQKSLREALERGFKELKELRKKAISSFENSAASLAHAISASVKTAIASIVTPVWALYQERIQEPLRTVFAYVRKPAAFARGALNDGMQWVTRRVFEGMQVFFRWRNTAAAQGQRMWVKAVQKFMALQKTIASLWQRAGGALKQIWNPIRKKIGKILDDGQKRAKKRWLKFKKKGALIAQKIKTWAKNQLQQFPSRLYRFFLFLKASIFRGFRKLAWAIRVAFTWTKILIRYSYKTIWLEH
jgi:hypothetical protein